MFEVFKSHLRFFSSASSTNFLRPAISSSDAKSSVLSDCVFYSEVIMYFTSDNYDVLFVPMLLLEDIYEFMQEGKSSKGIA